ncbi:MAG TPA: cytochrome c biogenesis protein CcdA [Actinomycetota bacterium]|nr:cytochrome c biogenesis protein CcdA [Actinomycetota bacterium]
MHADVGVVADLVETGLRSWWAPGLAFLAGVVSFASPCVFPLVPGYLSFVAGGEAKDERRPIVPILLFIAGFAVVFTAFGAFTGSIGPILRSPAGIRISGALIVAFGVLMLLYALRVGSPSLFSERRPLLQRVRPGPAWAFPLGLAFGAGWTPCIGPVLAGVLAVAAARGGSMRGATLLFVYSVGLGVPFLLVGLGVRRLMNALAFVKRNYHWIAGVAGVVMVTIGVLVMTNTWTRLLAPIMRAIRSFTPPI